MEKTITVYQTHERTWLTLQYGWDDQPIAYAIKGHDLRRVSDISTASLRRIERLLVFSKTQWSDCTESWFKTVHYLDS